MFTFVRFKVFTLQNFFLCILAVDFPRDGSESDNEHTLSLVLLTVNADFGGLIELSVKLGLSYGWDPSL